MSEDELRQVLREMIGWHGDKKTTARELAVRFSLSPAYLCDVLKGRRGIADKLANALGFERIVSFVPIKKRRP